MSSGSPISDPTARRPGRKPAALKAFETNMDFKLPDDRRTRLNQQVPSLPGGGGIFKAAAVAVLRQERRFITTGEITRRALERGLLQCEGKTPEATMASAMYTDIKKRNGTSIFTRPQEGLFGLREWIDEEYFPEGWTSAGYGTPANDDSGGMSAAAKRRPQISHSQGKLNTNARVVPGRQSKSKARSVWQQWGSDEDDHQLGTEVSEDRTQSLKRSSSESLQHSNSNALHVLGDVVLSSQRSEDFEPARKRPAISVPNNEQEGQAGGMPGQGQGPSLFSPDRLIHLHAVATSPLPYAPAGMLDTTDSTSASLSARKASKPHLTLQIASEHPADAIPASMHAQPTPNTEAVQNTMHLMANGRSSGGHGGGGRVPQCKEEDRGETGTAGPVQATSPYGGPHLTGAALAQTFGLKYAHHCPTFGPLSLTSPNGVGMFDIGTTPGPLGLLTHGDHGDVISNLLLHSGMAPMTSKGDSLFSPTLGSLFLPTPRTTRGQHPAAAGAAAGGGAAGLPLPVPVPGSARASTTKPMLPPRMDSFLPRDIGGLRVPSSVGTLTYNPVPASAAAPAAPFPPYNIAAVAAAAAAAAAAVGVPQQQQQQQQQQQPPAIDFAAVERLIQPPDLTRLDRGKLERWQGNIEEAARTVGVHHPIVGRAWLDLARAHQSLGEQPERAEYAMKRAWEVCQACVDVYGPKKPTTDDSFQYLVERVKALGSR